MPEDYCKNGHVLNSKNLYVHPRGDKVCRICRKESVQRHYRRNAERIKKESKNRYIENPEYSKNYRKENKKRIDEYNQHYRQSNLEKEKQRVLEWKISNPEKVREHSRRRRARKRNGVRDFKPEYVEEYRKLQDNNCYYCGVEMLNNVSDAHPQKETLEHKTPLSRGGRHSKENTVLACRSCNLRKYTKTEAEFIISY